MSDPAPRATTDELRHAIRSLEDVRLSFADIARRSDDRRKQDLVALRRRLATEILEIGRLADDELRRAPDGGALLRGFRTRYSRLRSVAAMHQAEWPAIKLDERSGGYERSAANVDEAQRDLVDWLSSTFAVPFVRP